MRVSEEKIRLKKMMKYTFEPQCKPVFLTLKIFAGSRSRRCERVCKPRTLRASSFKRYNVHIKNVSRSTFQRWQSRMEETVKFLERNQHYRKPNLRFEKKCKTSNNSAKGEPIYTHRTVSGPSWI